MTSAVEVCPIQLPGRENRLRELPFTNMPDLICVLAEVLLPWMDQPFALFGHSMGALIAFELARHLRNVHRLGPAHLFVSGRRAPQLTESEPPIHRLPEQAFLQALRVRYGGIPEIVLQDRELLDLFLPTLRADLALVENYSHRENYSRKVDVPLDCPISAYGGRQDGWVAPELMLGWQECTSGLFRLKLFPGNHFFHQTARPLVLRALVEELIGSSPDADGQVAHALD